MRQLLLFAVFLGILVMIDGITNDYRMTQLFIDAFFISMRDFLWFVGSLIGLTR